MAGLLASVPQPSASKARLFQTRHDVRILAHRFPNQIGSVILNHRDDRTLVDPEIVGIEPAYARDDVSVMWLDRQLKCRIVGINKSIIAKEILPVLLADRDECGHGDLRREWNRSARCRRGQSAIIPDIARRRAPRGVGVELPGSSIDDHRRVVRTIDGSETPYVGPVILPLLWIVNRVQP